ncbi:MAG: J domain-containing protein [Candidatus Limnocylindrales bacterium]|jgi:DnaJ-class molecular chaperone
MEYKDYYKTLGVARTAPPAEIRKAYRRLARELHPDRNPGDKRAESRFKEVNEAHEVLADPEKRKQYDLLGSNWERVSHAGGGAGSPFAGDPFGPGGPFAGYGGTGQSGNVRYEFHSTGSDEFSDFFRMFFGGAAPAGAAQANTTTRRSGAGSRRRSGNPLDDLFSRLRSDGAAASSAGGTAAGTTSGDASGAGAGGPAPRDRGARRTGDVEVEVDLSLEEAFQGSARLVQVGDRRLEVKLPAGVETGSKIRLSGKAGSGADAGDLYLVAKIRPHPVFTRVGADLTRELPITLAEALLGGEVEVETLGGRVLLKVPAGVQAGQTFRLTGQGMPRLKGGGVGDLYARVRIVMPDKLEGRQRKTAEEFLRHLDQPNPRHRT